MLIDSTMAVQLRSSSATVSYCRPFWSSEDFSCVNVAVPWSKINRVRRKLDYSFARRDGICKARKEVCAKLLSSGSDNTGKSEKSGYHPFEDILESESIEAREGRLTAAETCRTIIEVNSQATLLFSGLLDDEVQENIFWPDLPYLTDEHGNIYFQVNNDEDIMKTLTSDDNYVQVIVGLDTKELMEEMDLSGPAAIDLGIEEIEVDDSDFDDDDEEDEEDGSEDEDDLGGEWVDILDDDGDEGDSDGASVDWTKFETMQSSYHMYFAKKLAEVASDDPINFMEQPPAGVAIQGLLRPAFIEEHSVIQRHRSPHSAKNIDVNKVDNSVDKLEDRGVINGHPNESASSGDNPVPIDDVKTDNALGIGTAFYKLEITKIQLLSSNGNQAVVELEDCRKARPDAIAHSASKIIARVNAAGETINALKSLCMRCEGIQTEEVALIGIDSLGFDLRVCSGTQVQTLRFAFSSRATSEYSAERQLNDMLFPRNKQQKVKQVQQRES